MKKFLKKLLFVLKIHKSIPLFFRFIGNKRIPQKKRFITIALLIGYVILPIDIITDFVPYIGWLDDWTLLGFLFDNMRKLEQKYKDDSFKN